MSEMPTSKRAFETQAKAVFKDAAAAVESPGSYNSEDCERCPDCMFTTDSKDCYKCTYCSDSQRCTHCTHCHSSKDTHHSSYCTHAIRCTGSSYLIWCEDCHDCVFCFGCAGLVGAEFHIFNERYSREEYFRLTAKLRKMLGLPER